MYIIEFLYQCVWNYPLLALVMGTGIYYTVVLRGLQFRYLAEGVRLIFSPSQNKEKGDISNFQSLMTALAGSVGIGNIAGVATAITVGGLGAIFWMWITCLFGMGIKYAEAVLAVKYRQENNGTMSGGPMFYIEKGLGWKWLGSSFAIFGSIAALGGGNMIQANTIADVMHTTFHIDPQWSGLLLMIAIGLVSIGGIRFIGKVSSILVPFMALLYVGIGTVVLLVCFDKIPEAFFLILTSAFKGQAAFGGFIGATLGQAIQTGICRGVMTSEAGLGTASMAAAAAKTGHPSQQGLISMTGSFLATVIVATVTGLVLSVTSVLGKEFGGKVLNGASLTITAFQSVIPYGNYIVGVGLLFFALTTILAWGYYGEKCIEHLLSRKWVLFYRVIFILMIFPGAVFELNTVWKISDIANGLMAFPNLIGILALSHVVVQETREYRELSFSQ